MVRCVTAAELSMLSLPECEWLVPGYFPRPGLLMILGEPRAGKSFLALQLSLALTQGKSIFPSVPPIQPKKVLYFYFDKTGPFAFQHRLRELIATGTDISGPLYMIHPGDKIPSANIADPACYSYFSEIIHKIQPDVVVFDVLREFHNADENCSTALKPIGDAISNLCEGMGIILVHHTKKLDYPGRTGPVRNIEAARGSNYIVGKADSTWLIHDGALQVESNFAEAKRFKMSRQKNGLWVLSS